MIKLPPTPPKKLWFGIVDRSRHQLKLNYGIDDLAFSTTYWYEGVDLYALEDRYGQQILEKIYFHILVFEANKLVSLGPIQLDPGPYASYCTPELNQLWQEITHKVWAQWRYQHQLPDYQAPALFATESQETPAILATRIVSPRSEVLSFCGGGKDSLVSLKLLEAAGIDYDTYAYAHSIYGNAAHQHQLIENLLQHAHPSQQLHHWISDDFVDSPVLQLHSEYGIQHILAAETPSSIFGVLPVVLAQGHTQVILAHERSADRGNLIWDQTGEDVNHQWGKSLAAEILLNSYVQQHLIENFHYFSLLKPLYDVLIFNFLPAYPEAVAQTHSCNIKKPWCARCAKCAYVWVNYMAYLDTELVNAIFEGQNLFDLPENQLAFRQMLGLEAHTPFECIGQIAEVQLAFELCHRKGLNGQAMRTYLNEVEKPDFAEVLSKYTAVDLELSQIPAELVSQIKPIILAKAEQVRQQISQILGLSLT